MATVPRAAHYRWEDMPRERLTDFLERRFISGERATIAHLYMKKGCVVPTHTHDSEQITYVVDGALKLWIGEGHEKESARPGEALPPGRPSVDQEVVVRSGEVLVIPSNVPHGAQVLEDTLDVDFFAPVRQDWIDRTDAYLRQQR